MVPEDTRWGSDTRWMSEPGQPRPWSLRAFVILYFVTAIYWTVFVSEGRANSLAWVAGLVGVYLLWRGSKPAMIVSALLLGVFGVASVIQVEMAMTPGGHHPVVHVIEAVLLLAMLVLILLPQTRDFYDVPARHPAR